MYATPVGDVGLALGQAGHELRQLVQAVGELIVAGGEGAQHGVQVGDHLADQLIAAGQRRGQRRGLGQHRGDGAALALEHLEQFAGQRVDLVGIQRAEQRPEAADERVDVERGRGPGQRDRLSRLQSAHRARALLERQIPVADQVFVAHRRPGALGERQPLVDGEVDGDGAVLVQGEVSDLADLDTGDAHEVAALEARHIREHRAVGGARVEPELPEHRHQSEQEDQAHHGEQHHPHQRAGRSCLSWLLLRFGGSASGRSGGGGG